MTSGLNREPFKDVQFDFASHIRDPEGHSRPQDVEARRMQIYIDLFFNNVESFVAGAFPIAKQCLDRDTYRALVREFLAQYGCTTPYFLEISQEFLNFLSERGLHDLPSFLLELCHYEWVELALDVAEEDDRGEAGSVVRPGEYVRSPLVMSLAYQFPVHEIGPDNQPEQAPEVPTYLIVYRNSALAVRFVQINALSYALMDVLENALPLPDIVDHAMAALAGSGTEVAREKIATQTQDLLDTWVNQGLLIKG